jgi:hypothetical protein
MSNTLPLPAYGRLDAQGVAHIEMTGAAIRHALKTGRPVPVLCRRDVEGPIVGETQITQWCNGCVGTLMDQEAN